MIGPVNEGVRRLSLVLGLVVALPWLLVTLALFFGRMTDYEVTHEWAVQKWEEQNQTRVRADSLRAVGIKRPIGKEISEYSDDELILALAASLPGPSERPTRPLPWIVIFAFVATPVVFLVPWGAVRYVAWIVDGFRQG